AHTRSRYECLLVDNASSDDTVPLVRRDFPWVKILEPGRNLGFAAANNLALQRATGRYLLLLNPDTEMQTEALATLVALLDRRPAAGAAGPRLLNGDGSLQYSTYRLPSVSTVAWEYFLRDLRRPDDPRAGRYGADDYARERQVEGLLGACVMIRREAVQQIGLLDERFIMYCEEVDWCIRLGRAGWQLWYSPAAVVRHHSGQSAKLAAARSFLQLQRSRFRLYSKWYSRSERLLLEGVTRLGMLYQMTFWLKQCLRGRLSWHECRERLALSLRVATLPPSGREP
ncbi:MAG TPA: glycosyltransferase family 2 protein, partial [Chloroflexota bacterium]|nr:glycosyltransferase family 2 protein [Chloroflexota bacterium]